MDRRDSPAAGREARRERLARGVLRLLGRTLPAGTPLSLSLAGDPPVPLAGGAAAARVVLAGPDAVGRLLWPPTSTALGEAYLRGDLEIEGEIGTAVSAGEAFDLRCLDWPERRRLARWALALRAGAAPAAPLRRVPRLRGRRHSRARDLAAVRFHYDVGNAFFALWLDRRMVYSCAYFADEGGDRSGRAEGDGATPTAPTGAPTDALDLAQEAKLELICRKLRLAPGQRLLDVGCGWGGLVRYAAERHGVRAVGVTLSRPQADFAAAEAEREGLGDRVRFEVRDYRDLAPLGAFDAVVSVGMFEHVGREMLPAYFRAAFAALRPGGLFVNHGIATTETRSGPGGHFGGDGFVGRYVFPDGDLVTVEEALAVARRAGFELLDVQSLRSHYALTLEAWVRRLEAQAAAARRIVDDEVFRTWRLYMAAARHGFARGSLDVAQLLLARPAADGPARLPLRPWW